MLLSRDILLTAGQTVEAQIAVSAGGGASTWEIDTNSGGNFFQGSLIQTV